MASILTNSGAMVALQTMKQINRNMSQVQGQISTGLKVGSAKDNAATWAISKVMESDVAGFKTIQDSLALGSSTVNVARNAAETTVNLLTEIKTKIGAAQEQNVDRAKIQTDIEQLSEQIKSVVGAAQFNGLNLVNGSASSPINVLSSLDRGPGGVVSASQISVDLYNLGTEPGTEFGAATSTVADAGTFVVAAVSLQGGAGALRSNEAGADSTDTSALLAGDEINVRFNAGTTNEVEMTYKVRAGDTAEMIGARMNEAFSTLAASDSRLAGITSAVDDAGEVTFTNGTGAAVDFETEVSRGAGGLGRLDAIDVDTDNTATLAGYVEDIEGMIQYAIDAAASYGSAQKRIDIQNQFVGSLMDSMKAGIGSLVDADMEETSARLQALQVQQQLGIQALSIANQQPQNILSLFR